ncbi:MAG: EamA family transporter [Clostridia bacterium]|nr:EamA family transporter [Clostridia bacterium]
MTHFTKPRLFMMLSMTIFGTISIFVRYLPLSSGEIALYRSVMAALPIFIVLLCTKQKLRLDAWKRQGLLLMLSGLALGLNWILLFEAYQHTTVSTATLCYYVAPVLVTVISPLLFREKMTKSQIVCFVMSTVGILLITGFRDLHTDGLGIALGLGAAVFYACMVLLNKGIRGVSGLQRTFWQFVSASIVLLPYVACSGGFHLDALDGKGWLCLLVVGLVHTALAYCLYFAAIGKLTGQQIAILSYIDPLAAVLISVFVLSEEMTLLQAVGGLLILVFSLWNELATNKQRNLSC